MNRVFTQPAPSVTKWIGWPAIAILLTAITPTDGGELFDVPLENPSFAGGLDDNRVPLGWTKYAGAGKDQELSIADGPHGGKSLLLVDGDPAAEIGLSQTVALTPGETYRVTAKVRAVRGVSTFGAYLQFRFLPSNQLVQTSLTARSADEFSEVSVTGTAPPGDTKCMIYLYSHAGPTPQVFVTDVRLTGGFPPPPPPPPEPVAVQYDQLKDLHLDIPLVQGGRPMAVIVAPASGQHAAAAAAIQRAIEQQTGVTTPIVSDDSPQAGLPIQGNLIVLGNRSTNKTISALYDLYYCLVDLKYPGPKGYVIRSVHNPFGDGDGVIVVGGSDAAGVDQGAHALAEILSRSPPQDGELSIGWTMETKLGQGVTPPTDIKKFETWEASLGYGSVGYFGWTSISKRMAMYYMTGDEFSAREVVRLSFPDEQAIRDIEEIDGERIENKQDPLAGFYHYNAHMAILFWDLIEESPVFSDDERLRITNAFSRQLNHRKAEGVYGLTRTPSHISSRHGQWSAISLYCLGRYFNKDYPSRVWAQCARAGELAFASLDEHAWVAGESDNLFWYNTGIAPIFTYMTLTGNRKPLENGVIQELLLGQEALVSGRDNDWALRSASLGLLNKAAYLTGEGRWITYRERTTVDTNIFRLGQSFWPDETLQARTPTDLVGKWTIHGLPLPAWGARGNGLPPEQSFYFGSYRSAPDASGDYILLDGFNGASRNPYHTFDILQLRIAGRTVLDGYHNQVLTSADGMVEPSVAMNAALLHADVVGGAATAVGQVADAAFCNWRRTISQRTGRYALVVDDLTFRSDSKNMTVTTTWQTLGGRWDPQQRAIRLAPAGSSAGIELRSCDIQQSGGGPLVTMRWNGPVRQDGRRLAFYLIGQTAAQSPKPLACVRVADNAAAMTLPESALAVVGEFGSAAGELVILAETHLHGHALTSAGVGGVLAASDQPIDLDWDFDSGQLTIAGQASSLSKQAGSLSYETLTLRLDLATPETLRVDGQPAETVIQNGLYGVPLSEGRHVITGASPSVDARAELRADLQNLLVVGQELQAEELAAADQTVPSTVEEARVAMTAAVGGKVADMTTIHWTEAPQLAVAQGAAIHLLTLQGEQVGVLQADAEIRLLHWWDQPKLLLAGCVDEKVIAFDAAGQRRWVFTSEMDGAVYQAAKTYWFKTAPGHEGVHGLHTGTFDEGRNRCFVGSACTLEILDETGSLVKRTPVFWGPGRMFLLVDAPDGGRNLLISRWLNGNDRLAIVGSRAMAVTGHGYNGVPAGHSYVGGWTAQNRTGLFHIDLDGDGRKEVATAVNGTWNRVTVYSQEGTPLYNAQFGPGSSNSPRASMRDMDIVDLDGDGKKEIVVALGEGLVVALSNECRKVWSTRLPSPPRSLACVASLRARPPRIVVGCDDGAVVVLNQQGAILQLGQVEGRPTHVKKLDGPGGPLVVLATDSGQVKAFTMGD